MAAFLNFEGACTYNFINTKTIKDKLNLIIVQHHTICVNAINYVRNQNNYN